MIIDYDVNSTIGHGRGYPTGLEHSEKKETEAMLMKSILLGFVLTSAQSVKW